MIDTYTYSTSEHAIKFRQRLVELVKAAGQEVIDRAEDLVGDGDLISDFDITLTFSVDGQLVDEVPTIELSRSYRSKRCTDVLIRMLEEDMKK